MVNNSAAKEIRLIANDLLDFLKTKAIRSAIRESHIAAEDGMAMQTIIVKKSHPDVKSRSDAKDIADKYGKVYTSRETESSYRFRQRPPSDFVDGSMRTEKKSEHVSVVWGKLKSKTAARWETLPEGWTEKSRGEFWNSLTSGTARERVKECILKMEGKVTDPGAFCAALADRESPGWRSKKSSIQRFTADLRSRLYHAIMRGVRMPPLKEIGEDGDGLDVRTTSGISVFFKIRTEQNDMGFDDVYLDWESFWDDGARKNNGTIPISIGPRQFSRWMVTAVAIFKKEAL